MRIAPFVAPHSRVCDSDVARRMGRRRACSSRPSTCNASARSSTAARRTRCSRCRTPRRARASPRTRPATTRPRSRSRPQQTRGIPAYVVMPTDATAPKRAPVERYGAEVTLCDNTLERAPRAMLAEVLDRTGAVEIHPFDDERVIAGAGTAALELVDQVPDLDVVVTPIGGGGLCSGTCIAVAPRTGGRRTARRPCHVDRRRSAHRPLAAHRGDPPRARRRQIVGRRAQLIDAMRAVWEHRSR